MMPYSDFHRFDDDFELLPFHVRFAAAMSAIIGAGLQPRPLEFEVYANLRRDDLRQQFGGRAEADGVIAVEVDDLDSDHYRQRFDDLVAYVAQHLSDDGFLRVRDYPHAIKSVTAIADFLAIDNPFVMVAHVRAARRGLGKLRL